MLVKPQSWTSLLPLIVLTSPQAGYLAPALAEIDISKASMHLLL